MELIRADIEKIVDFARQHQLNVLQVNQAQRTITLSGTAQQITQAFRVKLMRYDSPQGSYRGRLGPVHVPADLQPLIEGIFGLDNRQQARPHIILAARSSASPSRRCGHCERPRPGGAEIR